MRKNTAINYKYYKRMTHSEWKYMVQTEIRKFSTNGLVNIMKNCEINIELMETGNIKLQSFPLCLNIITIFISVLLLVVNLFITDFNNNELIGLSISEARGALGNFAMFIVVILILVSILDKIKLRNSIIKKHFYKELYDLLNAEYHLRDSIKV